MKKNEEISKREKSAAVGLVVSFVAMIAIVGMITFSQYQRKTQEQRLAEAQTEEEQTKENQTEKPVEKEPTQAANTDQVQSEINTSIIQETRETEEISAPVQPEALSFSASEVLSWPLEGNVILSYSMDETVYFSTLDQYKYNPAIMIAGEVGADILAATDGVVEKIEIDAQTGTTLTMDLGNGYQAVYGQLQEVSVQEGDRVAKGDIIGYLSAPTKYFSVEGPNLYFKLLENGKPINPMAHMEA